LQEPWQDELARAAAGVSDREDAAAAASAAAAVAANTAADA
jgi:hypothetical protein